jgi:hypothetical protein
METTLFSETLWSFKLPDDKVKKICNTRLKKVWPEFLATDPEVRVQFRAIPDLLRSNGSEIGSTQLCEYN